MIPNFGQCSKKSDFLLRIWFCIGVSSMKYSLIWPRCHCFEHLGKELKFSIEIKRANKLFRLSSAVYSIQPKKLDKNVNEPSSNDDQWTANSKQEVSNAIKHDLKTSKKTFLGETFVMQLFESYSFFCHSFSGWTFIFLSGYKEWNHFHCLFHTFPSHPPIKNKVIDLEEQK